MMIYHKEKRELHTILDPYFNELLNNSELKNIILDGITIFRRLSWTVSIFVFLSGVACLIGPIISIIVQHSHGVDNVKYVLPYPGLYPWSITPGLLLYKFQFIFEALATASLVAITSSFDPLYNLYVFQMIAQLREMEMRMRQYNHTYDYQNVIRDCVDQYTTLMKCRDILQKICN